MRAAKLGVAGHVGPLGDYFDPDGGPAEARLDDVGAVPRRRLGTPDHELAGQRWQPGGCDDRAESQLVHAQRSARGARPGVGHAGQVKRRLESAVFARATVAAHDDGVELEAPLLTQHAALRLEETAPRLGYKAQLSGALGRSVKERVRFE
jgi:hypothetical protein